MPYAGQVSRQSRPHPQSTTPRPENLRENLLKKPRISIDTIQRTKMSTREDALAARLKSLRGQDDSPLAKSAAPPPSKARSPPATEQREDSRGNEVDDAFETDDHTLEELLADVGGNDDFMTTEPEDEKVRAMLEELADSIPKDDETGVRKDGREEDEDSGDDSDGEKMTKEVDEVMARFKDEDEMEKVYRQDKEPTSRQDDEPPLETSTTAVDTAIFDLPDVPDDPATSTAPSGTDISSLTSRLAALRTPSASDEVGDVLPSVPTSAPTKEPKRLTSRTGYTDEDVDTWCTVCLEDATLKCLGCDDDPYCTRCWTEMHVGPRAGFDERSHKAVQFTKEGGKQKKVAVGA